MAVSYANDNSDNNDCDNDDDDDDDNDDDDDHTMTMTITCVDGIVLCVFNVTAVCRQGQCVGSIYDYMSAAIVTVHVRVRLSAVCRAVSYVPSVCLQFIDSMYACRQCSS